MNINNKHIILASASPRRKELLQGLNIDFEVDTLNYFEEKIEFTILPDDLPSYLSEGKSYGFHRELEDNEILITADTLVLCENKILGKPKTREDAISMLNLLSNNEHKVVTGVTLRNKNSCFTFSDTAIVFFDHLSPSDIEYYIDTYKPFDKAGSYGVQEWIGYIGIKKISGSFYTIMGLPLHKLYLNLQKFLIDSEF